MYKYKRIAATGNLACATGRGELGFINVNTGAASAVFTVYDNTAGSGTVIAVIDASVEGCYAYCCQHMTGLFCVLSGGNADVTVSHA